MESHLVSGSPQSDSRAHGLTCSTEWRGQVDRLECGASHDRRRAAPGRVAARAQSRTEDLAEKILFTAAVHDIGQCVLVGEPGAALDDRDVGLGEVPARRIEDVGERNLASLKDQHQISARGAQTCLERVLRDRVERAEPTDRLGERLAVLGVCNDDRPPPLDQLRRHDRTLDGSRRSIGTQHEHRGIADIALLGAPCLRHAPGLHRERYKLHETPDLSRDQRNGKPAWHTAERDREPPRQIRHAGDKCRPRDSVDASLIRAQYVDADANRRKAVSVFPSVGHLSPVRGTHRDDAI